MEAIHKITAGPLPPPLALAPTTTSAWTLLIGKPKKKNKQKNHNKEQKSVWKRSTLPAPKVQRQKARGDLVSATVSEGVEGGCTHVVHDRSV